MVAFEIDGQIGSLSKRGVVLITDNMRCFALTDPRPMSRCLPT